MSSEFQGPSINKKRGGLGRTSDVNEDKIHAFVYGAVAVATTFVLGTIYKITQLSDAEDLGINAAYDTTNKVLVYNHLKSVFAYDPDAVVYIMGVAQGTSLAAMCDKANPYLYKVITDESTGRKVKWGGVVLNPLNTYVPTFTTGLDDDVIAAIPKAQELVTTVQGMNIPFVGVIIEGRMDPTFNAGTLYDLSNLTDDSVSVVIGQDPTVAALDAAFANYADVGSVLGMRSIRKVSESLGSADVANKPDAYKGQETYPLTRTADSMYLSASLSSGTKYNDLTETDKSNLGAKRYIYVGKYEGMDGYFFNDGHNCIAASDDYAYQEDNAVFQKAARLVRAAMLPLMKGEIEVDPNTGFLPASVISYYSAKGEKALNPMVVASEISGKPKITIVPNQDVVGTGTISMSIGYVRKGILRALKADIGAINPAA